MLTRNWKTWLGVFAGLLLTGGGLTALMLVQDWTKAAVLIAMFFGLLTSAWLLWGFMAWASVLTSVFTRNWKTWLGVLLGLALTGGGLQTLLYFQQSVIGLAIITMVFSFLINAWLGWGLWVWREVSWVRQVNALVLTSIGFSLAIAASFAVGWTTGMQTLRYIYLAVMGFMLGINAIRLLLRPSWPIIGVARTMIEEAIRMRVALIFILMLLVMLPILPLILGSEDRVTYMVQRFLTYSMMIVATLLSVMTILLGARSVSHELSSRQVYMTLTKPLSRWQYLLGKWLGIALLNAVLVGVSGVAIYGFTMAISKNPEMNRSDRAILDREILTARQGVQPAPGDPEMSVAKIVFNLLEQKRQSDPDRYGAPGTPTAALPADVQAEVTGEAMTGWLTIDPGQSKEYRFSGLGQAVAAARAAEQEVTDLLEEIGLTGEQAKEALQIARGERVYLTYQPPAAFDQEMQDKINGILEANTLTLVISPDTSPKPENDMVEIALRVNGVPWPASGSLRKLAIETPQEISLPAALIGDNGELVLGIEVPAMTSGRNPIPQAAIQLNGKDATVEVFYRTGGFAANLAKAMGVMWLRLGLLAALGLAAGALLSFPVACLLCLALLVMSSFSGYITEAVSGYASLPQTDGTREMISIAWSRFTFQIGEGQYFDALKLIVRFIAQGVLLLVPSLSDFSTNPFLSEGRAIPRQLLTDAVWKIGLLWTGAAGLIGVALFSRKELAKVVV